MEKLGFLRNLFHDTFDKCFAFIKDPQGAHQYQKVELMNGQEEEHRDEKEYFNDWGTQDSIYKTSVSTANNTMEKPADMPIAAPKKNVLIGNFDDDTLVKKREEAV